ncbi:MAG: TetR/AcrR family transcriptional regulator [Rhizobiaceae bacterium]|nr:TetR/AcrR family transcriptional regulator [Rhizobiaceae bacterium]MCV0407791.1 TetR/AcrR family transcriptional regulator [Rhizobiaceae bacterium]
MVRTHGVGAATTKRIAAEAGLSEGSLYNHFPDKARLLIDLVLERLPGIREIFARLADDAALPSLESRLTAALVDMIAFYHEAQPILGGIAADPELLMKSRERFAEASGGPQRAHEKLASILAEEKARGRLAAGADPQALASMLIGACTDYALLARILGRHPHGLPPRQYVQGIMDALRPALFA